MQRRRLTVLLLDEREEYRIEFAEALRLAGWHVREFGDSPAALQAVLAIRPGIVVASVHPWTRGERLRFCRRIQEDARTTSTPVLLTATDPTVEDVELALEARVMVLTLKRTDGAKLVAAIDGVLAARQTPRSLR